jgi:hypothetical protein
MQRGRRPDASPPSPPATDEPALLRPRGSDAQSPQRSERNEAGYQETPITPSTAEANREAEGNCALLHRSRKSVDESCAPAETSPGAATPRADQRRPRKPRS